MLRLQGKNISNTYRYRKICDYRIEGLLYCTLFLSCRVEAWNSCYQTRETADVMRWITWVMSRRSRHVSYVVSTTSLLKSPSFLDIHDVFNAIYPLLVPSCITVPASKSLRTGRRLLMSRLPMWRTWEFVRGYSLNHPSDHGLQNPSLGDY
jgi:hypothetical protein